MIKTISNLDFAGRIIFRHMTLLSVTQSSAELLFARSHNREHDEGGSRFSQSMRNIYFLNHITNENNIFNIHLNLRFLSGIVSKTVREMSESVNRHIHMLEKTFATKRGATRQTQQALLERQEIYAGGTPVLLLHKQLEAGATKAKDISGSPHTAAAKGKPPQNETQVLIKSQATKNHASVAAKTAAQREQERVQVMPAEHGALRLPSPETTGPKLLSALLIADRSVPVWHRYLWGRLSDVSEYRNHVNAVRPLREISEQNSSVSALSRLISSAACLLPKTTATKQHIRARGEINTTQPQATRAKDMKRHQAKAPQERELGTNTTAAPPSTTSSAQIHPAHTVWLPQTEHPIWTESTSKALQAQRIRPPEKDTPHPPGVGIGETKNRPLHPAPDMMRKTQVKSHVPQVPQAEEKSISPITRRQTVSTKMITLREGPATMSGQARNAPEKDSPYAGYPQKIQRTFLSAVPMPNTPMRNPAVNARFPLESSEPSSAYRQPQYVLPTRSPKQADGTMLRVPIPNRTAKPPVHAAPHMLPTGAPAALLPAAQETPAQPGNYSPPDYTRNLIHAAKFTAFGTQEAESHRESRHAERQTAYNVPAAIIYKKEQQRENPARQIPEPSKFSEDIDFIKKSVKQTAATTQTVRANTAVNAPGTVTSPQGTALGIDQQVNAIADKVYSALERRLRSERMRKGLL